jgi:CIC family chloride channel protein
LKDESDQENVAENVLPLRDLFHFDHFTHFYRLYVPASILIGLACGLVMAILQLMIIGMGELVLLSGLPLYISPMIGGGISGLLIYFGRSEVQGSGISKAIEITHKPAALRRGTALTKLVATSISIGSGNPVGREGPAVLIGAAIGNSIGRTLGYEDESHIRVFLMMGSAAATAGIYKAPLGGALFATEAPYRRDARLGYFVPTVLSALASFIVFVSIMGLVFSFDVGLQPLFTFEASFSFDLTLVPLLVFFGAISGIVSILFAVVLMATRNMFTIHLPDWADPLAGSLLACIVIFVVGFFADPATLTVAGMGYEVINLIANNAIPILALLALLFGKLFASSFVVAGRVSGGVLASSLFVGATLGYSFGELLYPSNPTAFMVLGMGAVLAATTNTPVATTVMILEMSLSFDLVIPLAICISVSYLVSGGTSLYEGQKVTRDDEIQGFYGDVNILPSKTPKFVNRDDSLDGSDSDRNSTKS